MKSQTSRSLLACTVRSWTRRDRAYGDVPVNLVTEFLAPIDSTRQTDDDPNLRQKHQHRRRAARARQRPHRRSAAKIFPRQLFRPFHARARTRFGFRTDCALHLDSGITLEADSNAADAYASADQALRMIEKRLRRYKSRLKDRSARKAHAAAMAIAEIGAPTLDAPSYVIEAPRPRATRRSPRYNPVDHRRGHHVAEAAFGQRGGDGTGPDRARPASCSSTAPAAG